MIFLTARGRVGDRVRGLELGADDYPVKPFAFFKLLARIRALRKRSKDREPDVVRVGDLEVGKRPAKALCSVLIDRSTPMKRVVEGGANQAVARRRRYTPELSG